MFFYMLGSVTVTRDDGEELLLGGPKQRMVLALLVCSPGRGVTTDRLVESVWPEETPANPVGAVQVYVSNLRRVLEGVELEHRDEGYVLHVEPDRIDAERFAGLVEQGTSAVDGDPAWAASALREALALWRGPPFGQLGDAPALTVERARLEELRLRAVEARVDADLALGRHDDLIGELGGLTATHRLRERFWGQLMLALYRAGRQGEALQAYESAREILSDRLGIDPSPFLQQLHTQILRQDRSIDSPAVAGLAAEEASAGRVRGYELGDQLGSGTVGVVYRGWQPSVGREVAVKIVRPALANDPAFVRAFEVEAQRVARLEHPHIVPLYDYWREPDAAYLVMRWLRGGNLADAVGAGGWSLAAAVQVIDQVASGLDYVHRQGVAHLDIKPANVLLDPEGNAYLSDFGIARYAGEAALDADTLPYVSPEHVTDEPLTPATDIFSLGLVAFELLTGQHPYTGESPESLPERVRRQPLPPLRRWRTDLADEVDQVLRQAAAVDADERLSTAGQLASALRGCAGEATDGTALPAPRNPYKGLRAFEEADAGDFFGREAVVEELLARLDGVGLRSRLMAVVGPSGSGKSSLVRAGLLPALRQGRARGSARWFVTSLRPGGEPMAELERAMIEIAACSPQEVGEALGGGDDGLVRAAEAALAEPDSELVLVVDQFEELFSLATAPQRQRFTALLRCAASDEAARVRMVLTVRADVYDQLLADPELGAFAATITVAVPALARQELERAVAEPARAVGVEVPGDVLAEITGDLAAAPAALPLLQYALTELFERRAHEALTLESYHAIGGVHGALAGRAEQLYSALDSATQQVCEQLFLRLVSVDDSGAEVRQRVARHELAGLSTDDTIDHLVETFGRHRLVTFDRDPATRTPTVEVAHEALLRAWHRLRDWIDRARTDLVMQRRLAAAAAEWHTAGCDDAYLLHGARLVEFAEWAATTPLALTDSERQFLDASQTAETHRQQREHARQQREARLQRRSTNRLRAVAVLSLVVALTAGGLSLFAFHQRDQAQQRQRLATARGLAAAATAELDTDPERSILLGMQAVRATKNADGTVLPQAQTALRRALRRSQLRRRLPAGSALALAPDGRIAILDSDGTLTVRAPESTEPIFELAGQSAAPVTVGPPPEGSLARADDVDFSPEGDHLVVADADLRGAVRDATSGEVRTRLKGKLTRPRFGPDGERIAAIIAQASDHAPGQKIGIWDPATGELVQQVGFPSHLPSGVRGYAFAPDGEQLAIVRSDTVRLWDLTTGEPAGRLRRADGDTRFGSVAFHPEGGRVAVGTINGQVLVFDIDDGAVVSTFAGHPTGIHAIAFRSDGERLVTTSNRTARVWDADTGEELFVLRGHTEPVSDAVFTGNDGQLVTTSVDNTTRIWNVKVPEGVAYSALPTPDDLFVHGTVRFAPNDRQIARIGPDQRIHIHRLQNMKETLVIDPEREDRAIRTISDMAYSRDGSTLAGAVIDPGHERVGVWDASTGAHRTNINRIEVSVRDLALDSDGSTLITATLGGPSTEFLRAVDLESGERQFNRELPERAVEVEYTRQEARVVVALPERVLVVDAATGETLHELEEVEGSIRDMALAGNHQVVVAGTSESSGFVQRLDLSGGEIHRTEHQSRIVSVDTSEDALAVATRSGAVEVKDLETGEARFTLSYEQPVREMKLSSGGRYLATMVESRIHLHLVELDDLLELASDRVTRSLTEAECKEYLGKPCPNDG